MKLPMPSCLTAAIALCTMASSSINAQEVPGAGLIYQQTRQPTLTPLEPSVELELEGTPLVAGAEGGIKVALRAIHLKGNAIFSDDE